MSNAVGSDKISKIVGYIITGGDFRVSSPNLPMRVAVLGEANEANQSLLDLNPREIKSAQQAGVLYGYGSPIYLMLRVLLPITNDGVAGIPVIVYPQAKAGGAAAKVIDVTPTGTATKSGTHTIVVAGRDGLDGGSYDINIVVGDTPAVICDKIVAALNNVIGCPVIVVDGTTKVTCTTKWAGLTAQGLNITVDTNDADIGVTYAVAQTTAGIGTPTVDASLALFASNWNTIVVNGYGAVTAVLDSLEAFNGRPDPTIPTGRYRGIIMKPFIAISGSVLDDPSSLTDGRLSEVTNAIAPAPLSAGLAMEAAANMAVLLATITQDSPHLDVSGRSYPDMPTPAAIGSMGTYDNRDAIVKKGCSTVDLIAGKYQVQDLVTTYHPLGEIPPQFRYVRNLMIDFNIRYSYYIEELIHVVGHALADDDSDVEVDDVVKPKMWKQALDKLAEDFVRRALTVNKEFTQESITVNIGDTNPDRFETFFKYKRSGYARIASTVAQAGFNFGKVN